MDGVFVNGVEIAALDIRAEAQNHPSSAPEVALSAAAEALVVRALLLQEARRLGMTAEPVTDAAGRREIDDDALIRSLVEAEVTVPEADEATCSRYYYNNRGRFRSPELYEAAHILFACDPKNKPAYALAVEKADAVIAEVTANPTCFATIAAARSDCTSAANGGRLGQVARGDTVPEFETFLVGLEEGQLCPVPVKSRYGAHVLRLDRKIAGRPLPLDVARARIADYLHEASWRRALAQYVAVLAGRAAISGAHIERASSPLVQ